MVIAIDLDGVVFDSEEYFRTYSHLYDIALVGNGLRNSTEMAVHDRYGWDKETANQFYAKYTAEVLERAPLRPGVRYVLNKLKEMGHTLICITLRGHFHECEVSITEKRVKELNLPFEKILYNQKNKLTACIEEGVELIIDDNPNTAKLVSDNGIKCFHFRGAGLRKVEGENIAEVQNWADVYEKILKLTK